jgi:hypothetical protein
MGGEIADEHADAMYDRDDEEEEAKAMPGYEVHCKHCHQGPFTWTHTGVRWRLVGDRGKLHECGGVPGSADDFDVL